MNAYIYCADLFCPDCTNKIKEELAKHGKVPEDPSNESSFDSDDFPKGPYGDGGGESDSPQHCAGCGKPLDNPLTENGVSYVLEKIQESIEEAIEKGRKEAWDRIMPMPGTSEEAQTYWAGSRHVDILRYWAEDLKFYSLEREEDFLISLFLDLSEPVKANKL